MTKSIDKLQLAQLYAWNHLTGFTSAVTGEMARVQILFNTKCLYELFL